MQEDPEDLVDLVHMAHLVLVIFHEFTMLAVVVLNFFKKPKAVLAAMKGVVQSCIYSG